MQSLNLNNKASFIQTLFWLIQDFYFCIRCKYYLYLNIKISVFKTSFLYFKFKIKIGFFF